MRAIIDTNIFISGLLGSGACRNIVASLKEAKFNLVISEVLFEEFKFVIERTKFHPLINNEEKIDVVSFIKSRAIFVKPKEKVKLCRDSKDDKILECALEGNVDSVVTGDKDLLVLGSFRGIPILKPEDFLIRLKK